MNKTIIININGIVFHIEEDAYEVLRSYMNEVKRHFAYSTDSEEIVTDIENRLAEMFSEQLAADQKQVIVLSDVSDVTGKMGNVSDFDLDDDEDVHTHSSYGIGKKLFRDIDDRVVSGVCSGIGHYFGIEAQYIRLVALLSIVLAGSGFAIYIILWIVMPKAVTRADKMAMKGEPINIQNFKRNFDEEVEGLKSGFNRAQRDARPALSGLLNVIGSILKFFVKMVIAFVALIGVITMIALFIGLFTFLGFWNSNQLNTFPFNIVNPGYKSVLTLSAFIVIFIPVAALVMFAIRVLVTRIAVSKTIYFSMLIIWLAGLVLGVYHVSKIASDFHDEAKFAVTTNLARSAVYYLKVNPVRFLTKEDSLRYDIDPSNFEGRIIINSRRRGDFNQPNNVDLQIVRGEFEKPVLIQEFSAKGPDFETALATARRAGHGFVQKDSLLMFDGSTHLQRGELWRDQSVNLVLRLPENTRLRIESNVNPYLDGYNLWECQPKNARNDFLSEWIMTSAGLKCQNDSSSSDQNIPGQNPEY
ncbi:MAG: PspC domain-containing protein [Daejeonella sp.]